MKQIKAVHLLGFQSHVNTLIDLSGGLTVLTGETDSGKTAIIRAIRWVTLGEPSGEDFVNKAVGSTTVTLIMANGDAIVKTRKSGKTSYQIKYADGVETTYEKAEVPEEVQEITGIKATAFADFETTLNFAYQLEQPFLLGHTASTGAKVLGKLAGTESVDAALGKANKETIGIRNERNRTLKNAAILEEKLVGYQDVEAVEATLNDAQSIIAAVEQTLEQQGTLTKLLQGHRAATAKMILAADEIKQLINVPYILTAVDKLQKLEGRYSAACNLYKQYNELQNKLSGIHATLEKLQVIPTDDEVNAVLKLHNQQAKLAVIKDAHDKAVEAKLKSAAELHKWRTIDAINDTLELDVSVQFLRLENLRKAMADYQKAVTLRDDAAATIATLEVLPEITIGIHGIEKVQSRLVALNGVHETWTEALVNMARLAELVYSAAEEKAAADAELQRIWDEVEVCPLCEQQVH